MIAEERHRGDLGNYFRELRFKRNVDIPTLTRAIIPKTGLKESTVRTKLSELENGSTWSLWQGRSYDHSKLQFMRAYAEALGLTAEEKERLCVLAKRELTPPRLHALDHNIETFLRDGASCAVPEVNKYRSGDEPLFPYAVELARKICALPVDVRESLEASINGAYDQIQRNE